VTSGQSDPTVSLTPQPLETPIKIKPVGGELIGALLHTSDHSPDNRRGFLCGLVAVFGSMGNLLGSIVSVWMRYALTEGI
jgi:hypothetical protein